MQVNVGIIARSGRKGASKRNEMADKIAATPIQIGLMKSKRKQYQLPRGVKKNS